ncbi:hypothetical protein [Streptomyces catenulae]|uniref:Albicidin resistance protein n=1 Tax=Streptomyces catenulae TaxID=66875 RepID=A0ABV2Z421_9ACTN|nr:hypothetical protein [Streptomyces catenulae]
MDAELTALATAGATTLVQQMATEGWAQVRGRFAAFLARRRGTDDEEALRGELDASRDDLIAARQDGDEESAADVVAVWRGQLRRLLREDPAAAEELAALEEEWRPRQGGTSVRDVHNSMSGSVQQGIVIQAGVISRLHTGDGPFPR